VNWSNSDGLPRPEEFPLGSMESRAAARALLERRDRVDVRLVTDVPRPYGHVGNSYKYQKQDGTVVEVVIRNSRLKESTDYDSECA
jgi:hypothetical protein